MFYTYEDQEDGDISRSTFDWYYEKAKSVKPLQKGEFIVVLSRTLLGFDSESFYYSYTLMHSSFWDEEDISNPMIDVYTDNGYPKVCVGFNAI